MAIGAKVTLRGDRMYEFLDRLVTIALPRVKDFRGLNPKSFDGRGNFACGLKEHIVFPEIDYDKVDEIWGMDVIVCTSAKYRRRSARAAARLQLPVPQLEDLGPQPERPLEEINGQDQFDQEEQPAPQAGRPSMRPSASG